MVQIGQCIDEMAPKSVLRFFFFFYLDIFKEEHWVILEEHIGHYFAKFT